MKIRDRIPGQNPQLIVKAWAKGEIIPAGRYMLLDSSASASEYCCRQVMELEQSHWMSNHDDDFKCMYTYWTIEPITHNEWGEIAP